MSTRIPKLKIMGGFLLIAILAGCSAIPTQAPTVDVQPTIHAVQTQSELTVVAGLTQNAPAATQTETQTPTAPAPSSTSTPAATATVTAIPWTPTATQADWECTVINLSPDLNSTFGPGADFDAVWVVTNSGKEKWLQNNIDISHYSGANMEKSVTSVDLPSDIAAKGTVTVRVDMTAPAEPGTFSTTWAVKSGSQIMCLLYLTIYVQ